MKVYLFPMTSLYIFILSFPPPLRPPVPTHFVHRPGSKPLQQPAQHRPILQRTLEETLRVRDALLGGLQDPQRDEPRYRLLGRIHVRQGESDNQKGNGGVAAAAAAATAVAALSSLAARPK